MAASDEDPLDRAWTEVEVAWDDEARHEQLLVLADSLDRLAELGGRYRTVRQAGGERAAIAERYQKQIVERALGRLTKTPLEKAERGRIEWIFMGVSIALFAAALWSAFRTFS